MSAVHRSAFDVRRGLKGTVFCAGLGFVGCAVIFGFLTVGRWWLEDAPAMDRDNDLHRLRGTILGPLLGCTVVCACAGWATYAPGSSFRFARTLAILFAASVPVWVILFSLELTPPRAMRHPWMSLAQFALVIFPPLLASASLTILRLQRSNPSQSEKQTSAETSSDG